MKLNIEKFEERVVPSSSVPEWSSYPDAPAKLYLDFDGHFEASYGVYKNVSTPVFSLDGNANFSQQEIDIMHAIWLQVSEDYAPFNIDVTTKTPDSFGNREALRVSIGGNGSWTGGNYGGIAYLSSFTNQIPNVAYVFSSNLGNYSKYVAEAASHEAGHGFGAHHQSRWDSRGKTQEYYTGPGDGTAPIMGNSYSATRGLWWYGRNSNGIYIDDMSVIGGSNNGFGFRIDDYGGSINDIVGSTAKTGHVVLNGLIGTMDDADYFKVEVGDGISKFILDVPYANNLDPILRVFDANGTLVSEANPQNSFDASLSLYLSAGTYYVSVTSAGISAKAIPNESYGHNVGQYSLELDLVPADTYDPLPAAPSNLFGVALSTSEIQLTWRDNANDETGFVIERSLNGTNWSQVFQVGENVTTWADFGLSPNTKYYYRVLAFNSYGNSAYSNVVDVTTHDNPPVSPSNLSGSAVSSRSIALTWTDNSTNETGFRVERSLDGINWNEIVVLGANITSWSDSGLTPSTTYFYRVRAYNAFGLSSYSNTVDVTTLDDTSGNYDFEAIGRQWASSWGVSPLYSGGRAYWYRNTGTRNSLPSFVFDRMQNATWDYGWIKVYNTGDDAYFELGRALYQSYLEIDQLTDSRLRNSIISLFE